MASFVATDVATAVPTPTPWRSRLSRLRWPRLAGRAGAALVAAAPEAAPPVAVAAAPDADPGGTGVTEPSAGGGMRPDVAEDGMLQQPYAGRDRQDQRQRLALCRDAELEFATALTEPQVPAQRAPPQLTAPGDGEPFANLLTGRVASLAFGD